MLIVIGVLSFTAGYVAMDYILFQQRKQNRLTNCLWPYHHMYARPSALPKAKKLRCPGCHAFAR